MRISVVLFDLFGTLLILERNSRPLERLAKRAPKDLRAQLRKRLLTKPMSDVGVLATEIGVDLGSIDLSQIRRDLERDVRSAVLYDDTLEALGWLRSNGVTTAVVSNLATPYKACFSRCGLFDLVDHVVFSCDLGVAKPDPAIFEAALALTNGSTLDTLMVGDSRTSDVDGAHRAGLRALHLLRSSEGDRAARCISSLSNLEDYLTEIR